jgi:hypothetical protein
MANWYSKRGDEVAGPYSADQLRHMIEAGELASADFVGKEGREGWITVEQLKQQSARRAARDQSKGGRPDHNDANAGSQQPRAGTSESDRPEHNISNAPQQSSDVASSKKAGFRVLLAVLLVACFPATLVLAWCLPRLSTRERWGWTIAASALLLIPVILPSPPGSERDSNGTHDNGLTELRRQLSRAAEAWQEMRAKHPTYIIHGKIQKYQDGALVLYGETRANSSDSRFTEGTVRSKSSIIVRNPNERWAAGDTYISRLGRHYFQGTSQGTNAFGASVEVYIYGGKPAELGAAREKLANLREELGKRIRDPHNHPKAWILNHFIGAGSNPIKDKVLSELSFSDSEQSSWPSHNPPYPRIVEVKPRQYKVMSWVRRSREDGSSETRWYEVGVMVRQEESEKDDAGDLALTVNSINILESEPKGTE